MTDATPQDQQRARDVADGLAREWDFPSNTEADIAADVLASLAAVRAESAARIAELETKVTSYAKVAAAAGEHMTAQQQDLAVAARRIDSLEQALRAAEQFIHPEVSRGPAINGWENTVAMVDAALKGAHVP